MLLKRQNVTFNTDYFQRVVKLKWSGTKVFYSAHLPQLKFRGTLVASCFSACKQVC